MAQDTEEYSTTAASNTTDFYEGQAPSTLNDGGREFQADIARWKQRIDGAVSAGGTVDALTATFSPVHTALADGRTLVIRAAGANATTTPTFKEDALTAKTIVLAGNQALSVGDIRGAGQYLVLKYNLANDNYELLNPYYGGAGPIAEGATGAPEVKAVTGASVVLIQSQTASASATINFTTGIDSTYDHYEFRLTNVIPATNNASVGVTLSTDGGSTYRSTSGDYQYAIMSRGGDGVDYSGSSAVDTKISVGPAASNGLLSTGAGVSAVIRMFNPSSTTLRKQFQYEGFAEGTLALATFSGGASSNVAVLASNDVDAVQFGMTTGNIASGVFALYGIKKA